MPQQGRAMNFCCCCFVLFVVVVAVDFFFVSHKDSSISHLIRHTINNSEVMSNSQITKSDKRYQVLSIVLHTL